MRKRTSEYEIIPLVMMTEEEPTVRKLHLSKYYIDSIDAHKSEAWLIMGTSSLEGNTWDGALSLVTTDGIEIASKYCQAGISMVRFSGLHHIVAARDDGNVALYSTEKLDEVHLFGAHDDVVSGVASSPHNEGHFASCGWDGNVHFWDWQSKGKPVSSYIRAHQGHVNGISYSPNNPNTLVSVGWDGYVRLWDNRENPSSACSGILDMSQISSCVSYGSGDDRILLVGTDAGDISALDLRVGCKSSAVLSVARVHKARVRRILSSPSDRSGLFVSVSDDTTYAICKDSLGKIQEKMR